jgi:4-diphosphocytidyl-2-C-methyl-D-erythritol kinase
LGLNELWNLRWSNDSLVELSAALGSDVGFFLKGPLAICTGRGELVTHVDQVWEFWAVIIKPPVSLSTAEVYRRFEPVKGRKFERAASLVKKLSKSKPSDIYPYLENDLETPAFAINKDLGELRRSLETCLTVPVRLSGSGSALYALFDGRQQAEDSLNRIRSSYKELMCWLVKNNSW